MGYFLLRRALGSLFVLFVISVMVFLIFYATPGADPARLLAGPQATPATVAVVEHQFGLDRSLTYQYVHMMKSLFVTFDMRSFANQGQKVVPEVLKALPVTFSVTLGAVVIWLTVSAGLGVLAAYTSRRWMDQIIGALSMAALAIPILLVGELANLVSQKTLHDSFLFSWVPAPGYVAFTKDPGEWALHLIIPWIVLSLQYIGLYTRLLRDTLREADSEDYVRTARAKGLSEKRVIWRHALRGSLTAITSVFAMDVGALLGGGAIVVEVIFGLPGLGLLMYNALSTLDIPVIMATALYGAFFVVILNFAVDVLNMRLDPRIAHV